MTQSNNNDELRCIGCGAVIQSSDESKAGYVPNSVLQKADVNSEIYCKRCFRLRHYNEVSDVELTSDDFLGMLNEISDTNALIVNVVDIFDFNGTVISGMSRFAGDNPILLVGNKVDLLPKSLKIGKMRQWLTERIHEFGIRPVDVTLISALKKDSVDELLKLIEKHRGKRDVYVVGTTNVGKSTIINQIISSSIDEENLITTSYFPGTTLGKIEIPLDDGHTLVDTPGVIQKGQLVHHLSEKELKTVTPKKRIKPKVYQLDEEQTLFLGGLARFDYISGKDQQSFVCYLSNELKIHRTKLENATDLYEKQKGKLLTPPLEKNVDNISPLKRYEFTTKEPSDIVFSGLGWINVDKAGVKVAGWAPEGTDVFIRKALI